MGVSILILSRNVTFLIKKTHTTTTTTTAAATTNINTNYVLPYPLPPHQRKEVPPVFLFNNVEGKLSKLLIF